MPVPLKADIDVPAGFRAIEILAVRWESEICPVCSSPKWQHYPFCRHCSMRCQRAGLSMGRMPGRGVRFAVIFRSKFLGRWLRYYDLCHDYLVVSARERKPHADLEPTA